MLSRCIRASRPAVAQLARQNANNTRRTLFTPTALRSVDLVQDMYLRELKNYKPTPIKPNDSEGQVSKFSVPAAPASPEESNIANDLKDYETQTVEVEGAAESGEEQVLEDWFEPDEDEMPQKH